VEAVTAAGQAFKKPSVFVHCNAQIAQGHQPAVAVLLLGCHSYSK
jgi:hypothetical protein